MHCSRDNKFMNLSLDPKLLKYFTNSKTNPSETTPATCDYVTLNELECIPIDIANFYTFM